jgi:CBS domain-containing protein
MRVYLVTDESESSLHLAEHVTKQVADKPYIEITIGHLFEDLSTEVVRLMNSLRQVVKDNGITSEIDSIQYNSIPEAVDHICDSVRNQGYDEIIVNSNNRKLVKELNSRDCGAVVRVVETYPSVSTIMERDVITIPPDKTAEDAAWVMTHNEVGCLVVTEEKNPIGIVTRGDLVTRIISEGKDPKTTSIKDVMTEPVITTGEDTSVIDASRLMKKNGITRLVVTEDGDLRGIVTVTDFAESSEEVMRLVSENLASVNRFFKRLHYDYLPP